MSVKETIAKKMCVNGSYINGSSEGSHHEETHRQLTPRHNIAMARILKSLIIIDKKSLENMTHDFRLSSLMKKT